VEVDRPLTQLGLDSLMAVELRNWIEGELRVDLPVMELMEGISITRLSKLLLDHLLKSASSTAPDSSGVDVPKQPKSTNGQSRHPISKETAEQVLGELETLSDDEVDSLLSSMLTEEGKSGE